MSKRQLREVMRIAKRLRKRGYSNREALRLAWQKVKKGRTRKSSRRTRKKRTKIRGSPVKAITIGKKKYWLRAIRGQNNGKLFYLEA